MLEKKEKSTPPFGFHNWKPTSRPLPARKVLHCGYGPHSPAASQLHTGGANAHHFCTTCVLELPAPGEATTGENKTHQHLEGTWGCLFTSPFVSTPQSWQCAAAGLPAPRLLYVSCWPTGVHGWRLIFPFICVSKNPFWLWVRQQELHGFMSVSW